MSIFGTVATGPRPQAQLSGRRCRVLHRPVITLMATVLLVAACASESGPKAVEDRADADGGEHEDAPVTVAPDREAEGEATSGATLDDSELEAPSAAEEMGDPGAAEAPTSTIDVLDALKSRHLHDLAGGATRGGRGPVHPGCRTARRAR